MNRKRKILTVVALAVFGAIIFFHYGSFDYEGAQSSIQFMTAAEKAAAVTRGYKVTAKPLTPEEEKAQGTRGIHWVDDLERVTVEYPGKGLFWNQPYPGITDVRMPLFVLAVFYAGLFFILGPTATKNRPPNP